MANVDAPFGFRPIRLRTGAPYNGSSNLYYFPSGDATAAFIGDAVVYATEHWKLPEGVAMITQAAATATNIVGVLIGLEPRTNADTVYRVGSTGRYAHVVDDPNVVFEVQYEGQLLPSQISYYVDITVGTGSTITGISAMETDATTPATTVQTCRIVGVSTKPSNTASDANPVLEVVFNENVFRGLL